jgi:hypothetical protein
MTDYNAFIDTVSKGGPAIILLLLGFIALLISNRLVTRRQHEQIVGFWRGLAIESTDQMKKMLDNDDITHALLRSVLSKAEEKNDEEIQ